MAQLRLVALGFSIPACVEEGVSVVNEVYHSSKKYYMQSFLF